MKVSDVSIAGSLLTAAGIAPITLSSLSTRTELSADEIQEALLNPIWRDSGDETLFGIVEPGEKVCIVVSDNTRKTAVDQVLPVVLDGLGDKGCSIGDISILVASGIHRPPTPNELRRILGPATYGLLADRVFVHDADDEAMLRSVGCTSRGHDVRVNRLALEADRLVLTGSAAYHYHAGFGGGRKAIVPGLASRDTIAHNHSLTLDPDEDHIHPDVQPGILDGNPVAEEMLESARLCRPDIIVNTVLSPAGKLIGVFSGDLDLAHRAACALVEKTARVEVKHLADIVIASAEGAPNWIQSHKALFNASRAVKPDGCILLIAPCPEGLGDERFRHWIKKPDLPSIYRDLRQSSEILGQTALSTRIRGRQTLLVTDMAQTDIDDLGIETSPDLATALKNALKDRDEPTCYLMPDARYTVPFLI